MRRVPMILQSEAPECGIACVAMIASYHGFRTDLAGMRLRLAPSMKGVTLKHINSIADTMGMAARGVKVALESLSQLKLPAILHWDMNHFVVLTHVNGDTITVNDPARGRRVLKLSEASDHYTGVAMEMTPSAGFKKRDEREKISAWQLVRTATGLKGAITQVLLLSLVLEILAIATPFFLQLVVDRVVVGRDRDLLAVLGHRLRVAGADDRRRDRLARLARRLHQHAAEPAIARHAVRAAAAIAACLVREAPYRRHRVALPHRSTRSSAP